jgi:hypothetical protein
MEDLLVERPRLGVALVQIVAERNAAPTRRTESFAIVRNGWPVHFSVSPSGWVFRRRCFGSHDAANSLAPIPVRMPGTEDGDRRAASKVLPRWIAQDR